MVTVTVGSTLLTASLNQRGTFGKNEISSGGHWPVFNTDNAQLNMGACPVQSPTEKIMNRGVSTARQSRDESYVTPMADAHMVFYCPHKFCDGLASEGYVIGYELVVGICW